MDLLHIWAHYAPRQYWAQHPALTDPNTLKHLFERWQYRCRCGAKPRVISVFDGGTSETVSLRRKHQRATETLCYTQRNSAGGRIHMHYSWNGDSCQLRCFGREILVETSLRLQRCTKGGNFITHPNMVRLRTREQPRRWASCEMRWKSAHLWNIRHLDRTRCESLRYLRRAGAQNLGSTTDQWGGSVHGTNSAPSKFFALCCVWRHVAGNYNFEKWPSQVKRPLYLSLKTVSWRRRDDIICLIGEPPCPF